VEDAEEDAEDDDMDAFAKDGGNFLLAKDDGWIPPGVGNFHPGEGIPTGTGGGSGGGGSGGGGSGGGGSGGGGGGSIGRRQAAEATEAATEAAARPLPAAAAGGAAAAVWTANYIGMTRATPQVQELLGWLQSRNADAVEALMSELDLDPDAHGQQPLGKSVIKTWRINRIIVKRTGIDY
jgi:hypothetical protein